MSFFAPLLLPLPFVLLSALLGLLVGSFLNVVIHRLPKIMEHEWAMQCAQARGENPPDTPAPGLALPRSHCPQCGHVLSVLENIPLLSYAVLRGKCLACKTPISWRYPLVEALTGVLFGLAAFQMGASWATLAALVFLAAMVALTFIDLDTFYLPDDITLPLMWLGLLINVSNTFTDLPSAVIGAAGGYALLWLVYWAFKLATGKDGMGYGDFKLLAAIGAWLGWQVLPLVVLLSSALGTVVGVSLILAGRQTRSQPIPFGPYLAGAGVLAIFWGQAASARWLGF